MKKALIYAVLILQIAVSMVTGTLATYTKTVIPIEGRADAKRFYIGTNETYFPSIALAPSEGTNWDFTVVNFDNDIVTEVDMDMNIIIEVKALEGKTPIDGLTVSLFHDGEQLGDSIVKEGTINIEFTKAFYTNVQSEKSFTLRAEWISREDSDYIDTQNADMQSSTGFKVSVTGTQNIN